MSKINEPDQHDVPTGAAGKLANPSPGGPAGSSDGEANVATSELIEIDEIVDHWSHLRQQSAEERAGAEIEREHFLQEFRDITRSVVRPTMEVAIERLKKDGGGGLIEEHTMGSLHKPRVTLWMSMEGEIEGSPRQDLNPFLQLDADPVRRRIDVWEGDMVENQGTSRATSPWELSELTPETVMDRIVHILRRAGTHGVG
jgi:hypothetical protein